MKDAWSNCSRRAAAAPPRLPADEMASLVRRLWYAESRGVALVVESHEMRWRAERAEQERDELRRELARLEAQSRPRG